jgi:uncharacterized protein
MPIRTQEFQCELMVADFYLPAFHLLAIASIVVLIAAGMQTATGMGFGMIAAPLLMLLDRAFAPAPILIMGMVVSLVGAFKDKKSLVKSEVIGGLGGRIIGMLCAVALISILPDRRSFMLVFGIVILIAVIIAGFGRRIAFTLRNLWLLSVISGTMGTITSVGAPPMALLYQGQPAAKIRGTLNAFFFFGCVVGLIGLFISGLLAPRHLVIALVLLVPMLVGMRIAIRFRTDDTRLLSAILLSVSGLAAIMLIFQALPF